MAAKRGPKLSNSFLFTKANGSPMVFIITPGEMKARIRPLVEESGGIVTSKEILDGIRIVDPDYLSDKKLVSTDFIFDSLKKGVLANIDDYRIESRSKPPTCIAPQLLFKGRIKYSPEEDQAILDYINQFNGQDVKLSGNKIWQEMERKKVTVHRWQSMRSHYLSFLRSNTPAQKGKLEFVEDKANPRSQFSRTDDKDNLFKSHFVAKSPEKTPGNSALKENIKVKRVQEEELGLDSLPCELQTRSSFGENSLTESCTIEIPGSELEVGDKVDCNNQTSVPKSNLPYFKEKKVKATYSSRTNSSTESCNREITEENLEVIDQTTHRSRTTNLFKDSDLQTSATSSGANSLASNCTYKLRSSNKEEDLEVGAKQRNKAATKHILNDTEMQTTTSCETNSVIENCFEGLSSTNKAGSTKPFKTVDMTQGEVQPGNKNCDVPCPQLTHHDNWNSNKDMFLIMKCEQLFENFRQIQAIGDKWPELKQAQILHSLYVSSGSLKEACHYLQNGLLLNGQEAWTKEEDTIIASSSSAINNIITKRGFQAVHERKQYLDSFH